MNPGVPRVLDGVATTLLRSLLPEITTVFGRASAMTSVGLLRMAAYEFDRAAARYVEENDHLRAILHDAATTLEDAELRQRCDSTVATIPARDYRVTTLAAENDALKAVLIDLHAFVETRDDETSVALDARIWDELRASIHRRSSAWG